MGRVLGIDSYLPHELSLSLGGCEVCFAILLLNIMMIKFKIDTLHVYSGISFHSNHPCLPRLWDIPMFHSLSFAAIVHHEGDC